MQANVSTMIYRVGTPQHNAARALAYWEAHPELTLVAERHGGYAVTTAEYVDTFLRDGWTQTSPEELAAFLI